VNEAIDIAELKFDGSADIVKPGHTAMFTDNLKPALQTTLMVVRHLKNEQVFKNVSVHIGVLRFI
jgi:hypothetical protein